MIVRYLGSLDEPQRTEVAQKLGEMLHL